MHRWFVTGAGGQVGSVLLRRLARAGAAALGVVSPTGSRPEVGEIIALDLLDGASVRVALERFQPTCIVHAAAISSMAAVYAGPERAAQVNVEVTRGLAAWASARACRFVLLSTDMVFDGEHAPYDERSEPIPGTRYGQSKLAAERTLAALAGCLVLRLPLLYGLPAVARETTFRAQVRALQRGEPLRLFVDEYRTPLWLEDAAEAIELAGGAEHTGVLHVGGPERLSRAEFGEGLAVALGVSAAGIERVRRDDVRGPEPRPRDLSLTSSAFARAFGRAPGRPVRDALARIATATMRE